ncbi:methyltransferase [Ascidiaceihabitans sp.]|uniref:tRNA1(Val) (adenine(37)-N6)-methyltransferase n=1 Tax=Ascidiaceihabitans sp. TaxID=1872644 RepID=UPI0032990DBA
MKLTLENDLTYDAFLGGKLHLWQPRRGYRAGVDPVLLAASIEAKTGQTALDLGCGVGAAALCLKARLPDVDVFGVERQAFYADLAQRNGLNVLQADLAALPADVRQRQFDHVLANPPYFDRSASVAASDVGRETAMGEATPLQKWVEVAAKRLKPKGYVHFIHRAERLPDLLAALPSSMGSTQVLPIAPRTGRRAELVILRARKEGRAAFELFYPRILHCGEKHEKDGESYTAEIKAVLRDGVALKF